jgi:hypothetical protein
VQTYTGEVTLGNDVVLTGSLVTLGEIIGVNYSLEIDGNGELNGGSGIGDLTVTGDFKLLSGSLSASTVDVTGTSNITGDITTTGVDPALSYAQNYNGAVTLGSNVNFTGIANSTVQFNSTVNGNSTPAKTLTITIADVIFNGTVGTPAPNNIESITVTAGASAINANITTTRNQIYSGEVTVGGIGKRTMTSQSDNIVFNNMLTSAGVIELSAVSGDITINGETTAFQLIAEAPNGTVSVNAVSIDISNEGNEGENAAIYIKTNDFVVTSTAGSIIPGGRQVGQQWGQLCLYLPNEWKDTDGVVDGDEDEVNYNGVPFGKPNARWHQHRPLVQGKILYSFTEDSNGNGRLDRIRVQTNVPLFGGFLGFEVIVEGYAVEKFELVSAFTGKTPFDDDSFYIYLIEKAEFDGGNTPHWRIISNSTLRYASSGTLVDTSANFTPIDTIPPRIAYTLTLPEYPQTYVQMSEPAEGVVSALFDGSSVTAQSVAPANLGYLFIHSKSYDVKDLVKNIDSPTADDGYFQMDDIIDKEPEPNWSVIDPDYLPPKYPLNWGYTEYAKVIDDSSPAQSASGTIPFSDVFTPPNKLLTVDMMRNIATVKPSDFNSLNPVIRRVTDVLVSKDSAAGNYFTLPVWARPSGGGDSITQFDGTAYLEKNAIEKDGITLQARIDNNLNITPLLFWTTKNIPADMRNPKEATEDKKVGGLWLPDALSNPLYNYVPLSSGIDTTTAAPITSQLFNYDIPANKLANSDGKFEFIFRLSSTSDMFIARLGALPGEWYERIRPFSFDIQGMRYQRGGVTILNNVINSDKKETAHIRYDLPRAGRVTVQIYTLDGTLVKSIRRNENRESGSYVDTWDGSNNGGRAVARGMYFVRVVGPDIDEIRKIMVVK